MTYIHNDPKDFAAESHEGFSAAFSAWVAPVRGGVVRRVRQKQGHVALVVGGGSGHYPAFGGLVGPGLASGAAMGNVFASPSAQQIYNVARAANNGGGVLLSFGNYAGDVLNFNQAKERLRSEGIQVETVVVTDDIASASKEERHKRRGIAGDLAVFKSAGWAADQGQSLDQVTAIAAKANERTRSLGVAFSGCFLPGATTPLFKVAEGTMEVGMGIHGEPGLYKMDHPTADDLAAILVEKVLADTPDGINPNGSRAAVIVTGLGKVKYEELFVLYRRIDQLLQSKGVVIVEPECGELVTSFDMAGVSLTLFWLDDELEEAWKSPSSTPAYRKGAITSEPEAEPSRIFDPAQLVATVVEGTQISKNEAKCLALAINEARKLIDQQVDELGRLDAIAGDGDHGIGMQRGVQAADKAAEDALAAGAGAAALLNAAADAWSDHAGGTSGVIWGVILSSVASEIDNTGEITKEQLSRGFGRALQNVKNFGMAQVGDKTLVDTLEPFARAFAAEVSSGAPLHSSWSKAAEVAFVAAQATKALLPNVGRARLHADKSLGIPDPGALSMALILRAVAKVWE
jgi:dihydroxyacetone kinase